MLVYQRVQDILSQFWKPMSKGSTCGWVRLVNLNSKERGAGPPLAELGVALFSPWGSLPAWTQKDLPSGNYGQSLDDLLIYR